MGSMTPNATREPAPTEESLTLKLAREMWARKVEARLREIGWPFNMKGRDNG